MPGYELDRMRYYPINLDIGDREVIVVGGGPVASRKCAGLIAAGARVTVVAPVLDATLATMAASGRLKHVAREYAPGDLAGAFLAFAATGNRDVNRAVAAEARARSILADITDAPELGSFISPAVLTRGELLITVATGGRSPALARKIRDELKSSFGPEYAAAIAILGAIREKLLTEAGNSAYNKKILNALVDRDLPSLVKNQTRDDIDRLLVELFGPGFTLAELEVEEKDPA
jgi:precorrin-2 dehydrogenase/sirohydrochlorin ferrochelatase